MKVYKLKLVEGTEDQYKVYTGKKETMLVDEQSEQFVKLHSIYLCIEKCEGDIDLLKFLLPKLED